MNEDLTPSEYLAGSDKHYEEIRTANKGTAFNQVMRAELKSSLTAPEPVAAGGATQFAQKQTAYMRGMQFGYIKEKFLLMQGSSTAARKMALIYYGAPAVIAAGIAVQGAVM